MIYNCLLTSRQLPDMVGPKHSLEAFHVQRIWKNLGSQPVERTTTKQSLIFWHQSKKLTEAYIQDDVVVHQKIQILGSRYRKKKFSFSFLNCLASIPALVAQGSMKTKGSINKIFRINNTKNRQRHLLLPHQRPKSAAKFACLVIPIKRRLVGSLIRTGQARSR